MRLWIKDPLACLADGAARGFIVEQGRISEMIPAGREPSQPADKIFDASKHVVLPGLINTHHHMYQSLTRAHPQAINKELFPWLKTLLPYWARLTPESHRLATRLVLTELLMSGCTTAADHHYLIPRGCENAIDIQVEEARAIGMRVMVSRGSMDLSEKDGGMPPDSTVAALIRLSRRTLSVIRQNVTLALGLKAVFLVTTVLGMTGLWVAILADTGATVLVTANALRLLRGK